GEFNGEGFAGGDNTRLGGAVVGLAAVAHQSGHRGQGNDATGLAPPHHRHHQGVEHVVKGVEVGVDDVIPVVPSEGRKGAVTDNAGIAHHAVRGAVGFNIGFEYGAALPSVSHIELED